MRRRSVESAWLGYAACRTFLHRIGAALREQDIDSVLNVLGREGFGAWCAVNQDALVDM